MTGPRKSANGHANLYRCFERPCSTTKDKTYQKSLDDFFSFLEREGVDFPKRREAMDGLISDYLEFLSAEGEGRAAASTLPPGQRSQVERMPPRGVEVVEDLDHE